MTWAKFKEANRLLWMDKRHLIPETWDHQQIQDMADRCFDRLWGNHEAVYREAGFEEAFAKKYKAYLKV
jgi:hypothetical protein